ncbi:hypothetical protein T484DRAFT_1818948 [Baffinella frigidus]|nr:hypothetical protein T484DRAFT_1818948 [Cryptophyta sp. CCMP2293]
MKFREHGGERFCEACFAATIASRCARCLEPITGTETTALQKAGLEDRPALNGV